MLRLIFLNFVLDNSGSFAELFAKPVIDNLSVELIDILEKKLQPQTTQTGMHFTLIFAGLSGNKYSMRRS